MSVAEKTPSPSRAAVLVAHPDDETLWAGGTILMHASYEWSIVSLCRANDPDRVPRFSRAVNRLGARGRLLDLDDGPEQKPLSRTVVEAAIASAMGRGHYDLILTHSPLGEYTRHLRHEEVGMAVARLWLSSRLSARELWFFAYGDHGCKDPPRPLGNAHLRVRLPKEIWRTKRKIIESCYGFGRGAFELRAASQTEAFWCFSATDALKKWLSERQLRP